MGNEELERGRWLAAGQAWLESYESLQRADRTTPLAPEDLELAATSAYMLGLDDEQQAALERAHQGYLDQGRPLPAVRCAFWLGVHSLLRREPARATGWFARAQRLLERENRDCVEQGYLLLVADLQHAAAGDWVAASEAAASAAGIADRFGDANLLALALMDQGRSLVRQGRVHEGLEKLDAAMVEATAVELSPIVTGLVYCSVLDGCHEVHELQRANEWTAAMSTWCDAQPGLVPFTGICLIHRAELLQLRGDWSGALEEARLAGERFVQRADAIAAGQASYRQGDVHRLRGAFEAAERAYRAASLHGYEPQPGLALLRVAQGQAAAAAAAIDHALATTEWVERARLLPACVEIRLAAGEPEQARGACDELDELGARHGSPLLRARAAQARGAVELAEGDARAALLSLREAWRLWQELEAPYETAQSRVLIARACRALADDETAALELEAARAAFEQLGAATDLGRVASLAAGAGPGDSSGLTTRELQVLRLLATGLSNKSIAAELVLSKRTIDRHVSNIFAKLRVSSRAAATAYAYEHRLF